MDPTVVIGRPERGFADLDVKADLGKRQCDTRAADTTSAALTDARPRPPRGLFSWSKTNMDSVQDKPMDKTLQHPKSPVALYLQTVAHSAGGYCHSDRGEYDQVGRVHQGGPAEWTQGYRPEQLHSVVQRCELHDQM